MITTVIGIDPGKNIGIARIDVEDFKIVHQMDNTVNWDLFCVILHELETVQSTRKDPIKFIVEDFILFGSKAGQQIGSRMDASQVIGAVKYAFGKDNVIMQPSSLNPTAAKWSGRGAKELARNKDYHLPDNVAAFNHAHYYLVKNGLLRHRILDA